MADLEKLSRRAEQALCSRSCRAGQETGRAAGEFLPLLRLQWLPASGGAPAAAEPVEEKTEFDVVIKDAGPKKIEVIKTIRQLTSLGLKEAKDVAETAGSKVLEAVSKEAATDAKAKLEAAGAVVEVALDFRYRKDKRSSSADDLLSFTALWYIKIKFRRAYERTNLNHRRR